MNLAADFLGVDWQTWLGIVIGAIVSILISVLIYRLQKTPRTLDYAIRSVQDFTYAAYFPSDLSIRWVDREHSVKSDITIDLKEPRIFNYHIRNTGKRAIDADDFKSPIKVEAKSGSIIDVGATKVSHEGIVNLGSVAPDYMRRNPRTFTPTLMNPGDWIELQVITDGCPEPPELTSWIREESRPMQKRQGLLDPPVREVLKRALSSNRETVTTLLTVTTALATIVAFVVATLNRP